MAELRLASARTDKRIAARSFADRDGVRYVIGLILVIAFALVPVVAPGALVQHVVFMTLMYAAMGQSWNLLAGYAGQLSLGQAFFFGVGAYVSTYVLVSLGLSAWWGLAVGAGAAVLAAGALSRPLFRLEGHYFAIATLALPVIAQSVIVTFDVAGGTAGIRVPYRNDDDLAGMFFRDKGPYVLIALGLATTVFATLHVVERSRLGYYLRAIRNDEAAVRSLGTDPARLKTIALLISAAFTGSAGALYGQFIRFIDPDSVFDVFISVLTMLVVVVGGVGSFWSPLIGALVLVPLSQATKSLLGSQGAGTDMIMYAVLIIAIAVLAPNGILRLRTRAVRLTK